MFCNKCGAPNDDGAKFCLSCGQPLKAADEKEAASPVAPAEAKESTSPVEPAATAQTVQYANMAQQAPVQQAPKKKFPIFLVIGIVVAILAVIGGILVFRMTRKTTIDMDKYMTIEVKGYDGYGEAEAVIDWKAIEEDYGSKLRFTKEYKDAAQDFGGWYSEIDYLEGYVSVEFDQEKNLSNGMEINYSWVVMGALEDVLRVNLNYSNGSYKVEDLKDLLAIDVFNNLEVTFSGSAPNGTVSWEYTGSDFNYFDYSCDKSEGLSNGDEVTFTISKDAVEDMARYTGRTAETYSKTYTVEGLQTSLTDFSQVKDEELDKIKKHTEEIYRSGIENLDMASLSEINYVGSYFLKLKDDDSWNDANKLYTVYKVKVRFSYEGENGKPVELDKELYWFLNYRNLKLSEDGAVDVDLDDYVTPFGSVHVEGTVAAEDGEKPAWSLYGYETLEELFETDVKVNDSEYTIQDFMVVESADSAVKEAATEEKQETEEDKEKTDQEEKVEGADDEE